jgi:hypothetical protein
MSRAFMRSRQVKTTAMACEQFPETLIWLMYVWVGKSLPCRQEGCSRGLLGLICASGENSLWSSFAKIIASLIIH